jgi:ABC-type multidrug transport system permease subunit
LSFPDIRKVILMIPGVSGFFTMVFLLVASPLSAIVIGWQTKNRNIAAATGVLLFPLAMVSGMIITENVPLASGWLSDAALYYCGLAAAGGLTGFFALREDKQGLGIALVFAILWLGIFLAGIQ